MERDFNQDEEINCTDGPEHWTGRAQSDWDGSCVVITRKEDKGREQSYEGTIPGSN